MGLAEDSLPLVFKPRRPDYRRAWRFVGLFLLPYAVITVLMWYVAPCVAIPWTVSMVVILIFVYLILFRTVSAVDYVLDSDALVLRYGKLIMYRIRYGSIKDVRRYTLVSQGRWQPPRRGSWAKMPGLDTTVYSTHDMGDIHLLATSSSGPIVVIETTGGNFGINPAKEEEFVSALRQRVRWEGDLWDWDRDEWDKEEDQRT